MVWHIRRQGRDCGKYTDDQLRGLADAGQLLPSDLLWKAGMAQWVLASDVPGLVPPASPFQVQTPAASCLPRTAATAKPSVSSQFAFDFDSPSSRTANSKKRRPPKKPTLAGRIIFGLFAALVCAGIAGFVAFRSMGHDPSKPLTASVAQQLIKEASRSGQDFIFSPKCNGLTTEAAAILSRFKGNLRLDNLSTLSAEAAAKLAKHEGKISLDGLRTLSSSVAKQLAACRGELSLGGLKTLTPELAAALSLCDKDVWLNGVRDLDEKTAQAFAGGGGEGKLWLMYLERIAANAQQIVEDNVYRFAVGGKGSGDPAIYGAATRRKKPEVAQDSAPQRSFTPGQPPLYTGDFEKTVKGLTKKDVKALMGRLPNEVATPRCWKYRGQWVDGDTGKVFSEVIIHFNGDDRGGDCWMLLWRD